MYKLYWLILYTGGKIDKSNSSSSVEDVDIYKKRAEPMLDSSSDLYSELNSISIRNSSTLLVHFTLSTNYLNN